MRLRVLVVDGEQRRAADMVAVLTAAGYEVSAVVETQSDLYAKVRETGPDVIIIDMDSPDRDMLEHLRGISRADPRPIVLFCDADSDEPIRAAVAAGESAYVVDGLHPRRVNPLLQAAEARIREFRTLRLELAME